ncbi:hypothetical protein BD309DRAFT_990242 [Dichomitus squalens]|uniref:DUF4246 domain-containing protein n=1 Tax=Dichomitus squalens TaxID=114155 RepID=A0A4Q9PKG3_9APHY|nr:hypothetical protein BD309DRAFT_990242 [Dichomitus squalens]TBU54643.1 hypothetical protein BD310DRAFT_951312 [Dichomitus squalens]
MPYIIDDNRGWRWAYEFADREALNQELGSIVAKEGKCVVFPNIYQYRVQPFELADKTKPGCRKILCFFLVDPFTKKLPRELFDIMADYALMGTITKEDAHCRNG